MTTPFDNFDLFCRINVESALPHQEFVSLLARSVGGAGHLNSVTSDALDISVDDNDVFDPDRSRAGEDRWLYFKLHFPRSCQTFVS
jgi:hypothetical protein